MNFSGISNSKIGFSGIYGTVERREHWGSARQFDPIYRTEINLSEADAKLRVRRKENGELELVSPDSGEKIYLESRHELSGIPVNYKEIKIDKVDGESVLHIEAGGTYDIGSLEDDAKLILGQDSGTDLPTPWEITKPTVAIIGSIKGERVKMMLHNNTAAKVDIPSTVNLLSANIRNNDNDNYVKVETGRNFMTNG